MKSSGETLLLSLYKRRTQKHIYSKYITVKTQQSPADKPDSTACWLDVISNYPNPKDRKRIRNDLSGKRKKQLLTSYRILLQLLLSGQISKKLIEALVTEVMTATTAKAKTQKRDQDEEEGTKILLNVVFFTNLKIDN